MAQVVLKDVTKTFPGGVQAVANVSLEIKDKEFLVLVGPSGCGKSTTLRLVAGLEEITSGEIYIGDQLVNDIPPKNRDIAMVFQNYALYPHMTVYKNMAFGLKLRKYPKAQIEERVKEAAQILGIEDLLDRKPKALSGGQRQRVAVGRAIVRHPKVFLFDEPLSNLDAKLRVQMRGEISKLHTRLQATMIYVTHDQTEAMTMGERIVVMKDGLVQQVADPLTLYNHPVNRFVAGFICTPPMNVLEGMIVSQDQGLVFKKDQIVLASPDSFKDRLRNQINKQVVLGIRPEHFVPLTEGSSSGASIRATVEIVEPMGAEIYLYLTTYGNTIQVRVDPMVRVEVNDEIELDLDMKKAHFFDYETEKALT